MSVIARDGSGTAWFVLQLSRRCGDAFHTEFTVKEKQDYKDCTTTCARIFLNQLNCH